MDSARNAQASSLINAVPRFRSEFTAFFFSGEAKRIFRAKVVGGTFF